MKFAEQSFVVSLVFHGHILGKRKRCCVSGKALFNVARPNPTVTPSWTSITKLSTTLVESPPGTFTSIFGLHLGEVTGTPPDVVRTPGISFHVDGADQSLGTFDSFQTIQPLEYIKYPGVWQVSTRSEWNQTDLPNIWGAGLDKNFPYGHMTDTLDTNDSPMIGLEPPLRGGYAGSSYEMFFMFKPTGTDSIWVPLKKIQWHWIGRATKDLDTGVWTLSDGYPATGSAAPTAADWITPPPTWTRNAAENTYQDSPSGPP